MEERRPRKQDTYPDEFDIDVRIGRTEPISACDTEKSSSCSRRCSKKCSDSCSCDCKPNS